MRSRVAVLLLAMMTLIGVVSAQAPMPRLTTVEPDTGKAGDVMTVAGENLDKANVAELYLTDGKNDVKVALTEQADKSLKFKVPAEAKPGRFSLMILTAGKEPKLLEQPVKVTIE